MHEDYISFFSLSIIVTRIITTTKAKPLSTTPSATVLEDNNSVLMSVVDKRLAKIILSYLNTNSSIIYYYNIWPDGSVQNPTKWPS